MGEAGGVRAREIPSMGWQRFNFIPQGNGDHYVDHRCPGEWIAIELMKLAADFFTRRMSYEVPEQDLQIDWSQLPALPRSQFVITQCEGELKQQNTGS